ncbi:hypothetical protein [Paracidovorax citrulli]|nr:hypothetical protein [Paracidovorax citrulli]
MQAWYATARRPQERNAETLAFALHKPFSFGGENAWFSQQRPP